MIDLKKRPFYLKDEQINKIKDMMAHMTLAEKIGQVFCPIGNPASDEELNIFVQKYKPGAMMFRAQPAHQIKHMHETLQKASKIPLMLAANLESGGEMASVWMEHIFQDKWVLVQQMIKIRLIILE